MIKDVDILLLPTYIVCNRKQRILCAYRNFRNFQTTPLPYTMHSDLKSEKMQFVEIATE